MSETMGKQPQLNRERLESAKKRQLPTASGNLARELATYILEMGSPYADGKKLDRVLEACWDKKLPEMEALPDFYTPQVRQGVALLVGEDEADKTARILTLRLAMILSLSPFRRSYHAKNIGKFGPYLTGVLVSCAAWPFYEMATSQAAEYDTSNMRGFQWQLALELSEGCDSALELVREAILGDNSRILLSVQVIRAIVISGNPQALELLGKLLLAAQQQEGIRQQILENMDWGSIETTLYFLRLIQDHDLTRFSSVIRAVDTWSGLGYGSVKPALAKKCVALAIDVLSDPAAIGRYIESTDNLEIYFALWGTAAHNIDAALERVERLLSERQAYCRLTALYFVSCADDADFAAQVALAHLDERDGEALAWVLKLLETGNPPFHSGFQPHNGRLKDNRFHQDPARRLRIFDALEEIVRFLGNQRRTFQGSVFPWMQVTLSAEPALGAMLALTASSRDDALLERLLGHWRALSPGQRQYVQKHLLRPKSDPGHRRLLIRESLTDRSSYVRDAALEALSAIPLQEEEAAVLCDALSSRSSEYRQKLVELLAGQDKGLLAFSLDRLLAETDERRLQGGLSLLMAIRTKQEDMAQPHLRRLETLDATALSGQTLVLLEQLTGRKEEWTAENGFGLFDPKADCFQPKRPKEEPGTEKTGLLSRMLEQKTEKALLSNRELRKLLKMPEEAVLSLYGRMQQVFTNHADYEYEVEHWDGSRVKVLFGNVELCLAPVAGTNRMQEKLEDYPFWEEFLAAAEPFASNALSLSCILFQLDAFEGGRDLLPWFQQWAADFQMKTLREKLWQEYGRLAGPVEQLLHLMLARAKTEEYAQKCFQIYVSLGESLGEGNWVKPYTKGFQFYGAYQELDIAFACGLLQYWRYQMRSAMTSDKDFSMYFRRLRFETLAVAEKACPLDLTEYLRAYDLGLIPEEVIYQQLTTSPMAADHLHRITEKRFDTLKLREKYPQLGRCADRAIDRIVTMEERRGELPTPLTRCVGGIRRFEGMGHFAALLTALGKDDFYRGYQYSAPEGKRESLSSLLKHCVPAAGDRAEDLARLVKQAGMKEERLAQAAMYAPQWAALLEQVSGWPGLKSGVWLFHAHVNEFFSAEKETEVAIYSLITPQQFNDGAFDKDWFLSVYHDLGEKRFRVLYRCAKYITTGSIQHRRSQLYADAVLGKLDAAELLAEIRKNRNQDKLRAWPLIPLKDEHDALARYEYIRLFEKESRQFGAQRRDSEKKAVRTALGNLAITMGCPDVDRMIWRLEGQKLDEILPLTQPQAAGDFQFWLDIAPDGAPGIGLLKNGKPQKTIPAALKKEEAVLKLKETVKELTEQRRRACKSLETAMATTSAFSSGEVRDLLGNPVLGPMVSALLWCSGDAIGLPCVVDGALMLNNCEGTSLAAANELRVAHPHDFMEAGCWAGWQRKAFSQRLVQPFKQVFREYYPLTDEERFEKAHSRRYAGNQVQPKKAAALLRGRGWTVDYEEGLQKVCYEENLIVRIYAMADWFSPAEVEPPTLELVQFFDRATGVLRTLDTIPAITFSEAMRDLDLMVSVAHAGGVDPEASHSTVEMRAAIAVELLRLLQVENVEIVGSHAKIHGSLGNYSVHMGSAVTHMEGRGSLVILPVHSQTRGRMFLPFADEDPKTAEVMSKILLLAEDRKIKDPAILAQIGTQ